MIEGFSGTLQGTGWSGSFMLSIAPEICHFSGRVHEATDEQTALDALKAMYDTFASGRERFLRCAPEVERIEDFETKRRQWRGFVRFSYRLAPGGEHVSVQPSDETLQVMGLGVGL